MTARTLWRRKMRTGEEIKATLWYDPTVGDATLEIGASASGAEDVVATKLADALRDTLDKTGATEMQIRE